MGQKKEFGLVLAGGGGKGAYEIGVWKALRETGKIKIGAVSGTSVGALNAVLFAVGDYESAEDIWMHIDMDKILSSKKMKFSDRLSQWLAMYASIYTGGPVNTLVMQVAIAKYLNTHNGLFSREGLSKIIEEARIAEKIYKSKMPCYVTCYNLNELRTQYFQIDNRFTPKKIQSILLASSAIPFVFPKEEIEGKQYYDGGIPCFGDNVPVKPLFEAGWRKFIVVHLEREGIEEYTKKYEGCRFIHIFPSKNQGGLLDGTLDFNPQSAKERLIQGYKDMKKQIGMLNNLDAELENRGEKIQEIHAASKKYWHYMKDNIELDLDNEFDEVCKKLAKNRSKMNDFVLRSVTAISAATAQLDERHSKGNFQNLLREVTGKNKRLQHGIDKNMINSQQAVLKIISRLVESDVISLEVIHTLQNELYGTTSEMINVLRKHGKDIDTLNCNFEEISKAYNELKYQNTANAEDINHLYSLVLDNSQRWDQRFGDAWDEIESLKDVQNLQTWRINLKFRKFYEKEYRDLETIEKTICIVSDFFYLTNGKWNDELLLFVKSALDELGINPCKRVRYSEVIYKLVIDKRYREYLFDRNGIQYIFGKQEDEIVTSCETLIQGVYIADKLSDVQESITIQQIEEYLSKRGISKEIKLSAFDIACMLLVSMSKYHLSIEGRKRLTIDRKLEKQGLLGDVNAMQKYIGILLQHNYIEDAYHYVSILDRIMINDNDFMQLKCEVLEKYSVLR